MISKLSPADPLRRKDRMLSIEREQWRKGMRLVAGIDEAGRGPLAGPVVAAAVIFDVEQYLPEVDDSKLLSSDDREILFEIILSYARAVGIGYVDEDQIDKINILRATYRAMHHAVERLSLTPEYLLIDGNRFVGNGIPFSTVVDGDAGSFSIAAASIVAKVCRDRLMAAYEAQYPGYGFAKHKGYATKEHRNAIQTLGLCDIHRRTFTTNNQLELSFETGEETGAARFSAISHAQQ